jgi:hypothetical protein
MQCSGCHNDNDRAPHRYCRRCHAAYQKIWRRRRKQTIDGLVLINRKLLEQLERRP